MSTRTIAILSQLFLVFSTQAAKADIDFSIKKLKSLSNLVYGEKNIDATEACSLTSMAVIEPDYSNAKESEEAAKMSAFIAFSIAEQIANLSDINKMPITTQKEKLLKKIEIAWRDNLNLTLTARKGLAGRFYQDKSTRDIYDTQFDQKDKDMLLDVSKLAALCRDSKVSTQEVQTYLSKIRKNKKASAGIAPQKPQPAKPKANGAK